MFCSISGGVPEEPVVDKATGHLYEKRLVVKYIQETGKSPVTGESLSADDLVSVKSNQAVKPRPSPATSIPGLLGLFHNEWDALMLETHSLRQSLGTVRQELSQALYQHDASVRVIARLIRERDEARAALEDARAGGAPAESANSKRAGPAEAAEGGEGAPAKKAKGGITPDIVEAMTAHSATLSKGRKKRALSPSLATPEQVAGLALAGTYPLHKTTQGGILAIDFAAGGEGLVFTAGADHSGQVYDRQAGRVVASLTGHSKKVTDVKLLAGAGAVLTTSADKTARLWRAGDGDGGGYSCAAVLKEHSAEVTAASLHATGDYFVTASLDRTWAFYDVATATCLQQLSEATVEGGYTAAQFHPDGLILGTGTNDSLVRIWEVRQQKNVAKLSHSAGPVTSLSFSENGYYLATAGGDGVKLWDLRKLLNFRDLGGAAGAVAFDHSGLFLAAAGATEVAVHGVKQDWGVVKTFADLPKKGAHCAKWGADAKSLFVGASDHNLRVYEQPTGAAPMAE